MDAQTFIKLERIFTSRDFRESSDQEIADTLSALLFKALNAASVTRVSKLLTYEIKQRTIEADVQPALVVWDILIQFPNKRKHVGELVTVKQLSPRAAVREWLKLESAKNVRELVDPAFIVAEIIKKS